MAEGISAGLTRSMLWKSAAELPSRGTATRYMCADLWGCFKTPWSGPSALNFFSWALNLGLRPRLVWRRAFSAQYADLITVLRAESPCHREF
jgi:hypothetical protein